MTLLFHSVILNLKGAVFILPVYPEERPMIEQCPLNHDCQVIHILNLGSHAFIIGQIEGSHISKDCISNGKPDTERIRPMIFNMEAFFYLSFGEVVAKAYSVGRELKTGR